MTSTRGIRAGRAFVELGVSDKLSAGLRRAQRRLEAFGAGVQRLGLRLASIATAAFAPLGIAAVKAASDAEESLSRFAQVFGREADAAGKFADDLARRVGRSGLAARDALGTFQSFFTGLGFAAPEARELSQTLTELAIDFASFNNLSDEEGIERFISALSGSSEVLDRFGINIKQAALEQELLRMGISKSWTEVTEQEKALARLNVIMRAMGDQGAVGDATRTADSFANRMKRLRGELRDAAVAIGRALLPVLTPLVQVVTAAVQAVRSWAEQNPRLVATIFGIGAAVVAAGAALIGIGLAISLAGVAMGGLATAVGVVASMLGAVLSPIGLVVAAVVGLGGAIAVTSGAGGEALAWLMGQFTRLRDWVGKVTGGIADALAAGDIALAAEILWLSLKVVWQKGVAALNSAWLEARRFFVSTAQSMWYGVLAAAQIVLHALEVGWIETTSFLSKTWSRFTGGFQKAWESASSFVAKRMLEIQGLFDSGLDVEAAKKAVDQQLEQRLSEIDERTRAAVAEREARRSAERDRAGELNDATLAQIGQQYEDAQKALDARTDAGITDAQRELEAARQRLDEAIAEAKRRREEAGSEQGPSGSPRDLLAEFENRLQAVGDLVAQGISVRGTFNARAVQGLASDSGAAERTARATEQTAKNTRQLADAARGGGLTFA